MGIGQTLLPVIREARERFAPEPLRPPQDYGRPQLPSPRQPRDATVRSAQQTERLYREYWQRRQPPSVELGLRSRQALGAYDEVAQLEQRRYVQHVFGFDDFA